jgi:hypothetical protein
MPEEIILVENLVKNWGYKRILTSLYFKAYFHESLSSKELMDLERQRF